MRFCEICNVEFDPPDGVEGIPFLKCPFCHTQSKIGSADKSQFDCHYKVKIPTFLQQGRLSFVTDIRLSATAYFNSFCLPITTKTAERIAIDFSIDKKIKEQSPKSYFLKDDWTIYHREIELIHSKRRKPESLLSKIISFIPEIIFPVNIERDNYDTMERYIAESLSESKDLIPQFHDVYNIISNKALLEFIKIHHPEMAKEYASTILEGAQLFTHRKSITVKRKVFRLKKLH